jgi:PAS domain S-box-containing protein
MTRASRKAPRAVRSRKAQPSRCGAAEAELGKALAPILWKASRDGVALIAPDVTVLDLNPAAMTMAQVDKASDLAGVDFTTLVTENERVLCRRTIDAALAGREESCEFTLIGRKGLLHTLRGNVAPLRDKAGRVMGCLMIIADVSDVKRAETRADESESRYRDLVEASADWIWEMDADLRFTYFSEALKSRFGLDPATIIGRTREEFASVQQDENLRRHLDDLKAHRPFRDFVYRSTIFGGRWFRLSGRPKFDSSGRFLGYRGIGSDITAELDAARQVDELQTRFREAIEAVDSGFALWGADDRLVVCNAGYARAYPQIADLLTPGIAFEALLRKAAARGLYKLSGSELEAFIAERLRAHRRPEGALEQHLADGRWIQIKERRAASGGILSAWTDITEIKRREEALRASEERFALAAQGVNDGIWDWDLPANRVYRSERLRQMLGHDEGAAIHANEWWLTQIHPEDIDRYKDALRARFKGREKLFVIEYRALHASGDYIWLLDRAICCRDGAGRVVRMVGSITDITERKRMETDLRAASEAVREMNRQLGIALDNMSQGLTLFDSHDRLVVANRRYQQMYGIDDRLVAAGTPVADLVAHVLARGHYAPEIAAAALEARRLAVSSGRPQSTTQSQADGSIYEVIHQPLPDGGMVSTFTDITERKTREEALQEARETAEAASRAKSAFLAHMSHELRTPLNAIIGFSELIMTEMLGSIGNPRYKEYAGDIHSSGKHLLQLINDVLDISKIEAGKAELRDETVEVGEIIEHCAALIHPQATAGSLKVTVDVPPALPCLRGDARALRQILLNLLSNAVKFTPPDGEIRLSARLNGQRALEIEVSDTGIGMSAADASRVFEPFFQIQNELTRQYEGTGLGLSLVKGLVEMHGGGVAVRSVPQQGTTITAIFPAERVIAPAAGSPNGRRGAA